MAAKDTTDAKFAGDIRTPEVTWAQRSSTSDAKKNYVYIRIEVPDVDPKKIQLDIKPTHVEFKGYSESKKLNYHVKLELFADIDPSATKVNHSGQAIELVAPKKELKEEYWPRLLKDSKKVHFLKTNFDHWRDEDEQDDATEDDDYMSKMGGMGGMGADGGFGGIDFSKLGAAGLGGDAGLGEEEEEDDDDEEEEDEDMPGLEEGSAAPSGSKIQEVS